MKTRPDVVVTGTATAIAGVTGPDDLLNETGPDIDGYDPVRSLTGRGLRYKDRATRLALCVARDALADAGLPAVPDADDFGVVVSSNFGNVDTVCDIADIIARDTYLGTSPMTLPGTASNVIASWVAITHRLRGANLTLCDGETSGLDAVHFARLLIASGRVARVLVIGVEPDNKQVRHLVDPDGTGRRLFDGAAALVLEAGYAATARGAHPRAVIGAYARSATVDAAIARVRRTETVGLWSLPDKAPSPVDGECLDLNALLGSSSGAFGVLQTVAGVAWLGRGGSGPVLAVAGSGRPVDDASAALLLGATP